MAIFTTLSHNTVEDVEEKGLNSQLVSHKFISIQEFAFFLLEYYSMNIHAVNLHLPTIAFGFNDTSSSFTFFGLH